jgi:pyruvate dehydrogenase E2 component (dihydrolipoyllysine-residue acetyltransferase)
MIPLVLPQLSISMEEGTVLSWLVADGEQVLAGQPIVEVETDKSTLEVEAPAAGVLRIRVQAGATVSVEALLAEIYELGETPLDIDPRLPTPGARPRAESASVSSGQRVPPVGPDGSGRHIASPAARRLAQELGVDLAGLAGTGPGERIVFRDVENAASEPAPAVVSGSSPTTSGDLRSLVVGNIMMSWREIPHIHVAGELVADGLAEARRALAGRRGDARITVTDLLVLATAGALRDVPDLNGVLRPDGSVSRPDAIHLGLAVATAGGVVAPVLREAGALSPDGLARERARLVEAAREGTLEKRDLGGATCTLSNLGAHPVDFFAPVISGPQIALVAIGRVREVPVAIDGLLAVRSRLWVNVAIDHRGADGEAGGRFLAALERRLADLPGVVSAVRG